MMGPVSLLLALHTCTVAVVGFAASVSKRLDKRPRRNEGKFPCKAVSDVYSYESLYRFNFCPILGRTAATNATIDVKMADKPRKSASWHINETKSEASEIRRTVSEGSMNHIDLRARSELPAAISPAKSSSRLDWRSECIPNENQWYRRKEHNTEMEYETEIIINHDFRVRFDDDTENETGDDTMDDTMCCSPIYVDDEGDVFFDCFTD